MNLNILQIDDDIVNNMAIMRLAKKQNIDANFVNFTDPIEAIGYFRKNKFDNFDFIILDINMPKLSGWEVLLELEKLNINIPVLMVTSSIDPDEKDKAKSHKMLKGFFIKPITPFIFNQMLETFT